jgi:hypothetical protein
MNTARYPPMVTITVRISCDDLMHVVAEMKVVPLYNIAEDPAEVVRHKLDAAAHRCNNGEDPVSMDFTDESAANLEDRLWTRAALRAADAAMVGRAAALRRARITGPPPADKRLDDRPSIREVRDEIEVRGRVIGHEGSSRRRHNGAEREAQGLIAAFGPARGHHTHYRHDSFQQTAIRRAALYRVGAGHRVGREHQAPLDKLAEDLAGDVGLTAQQPLPVGEPGTQLVADAVAPLRCSVEPVEVLEAQHVGPLRRSRIATAPPRAADATSVAMASVSRSTLSSPQSENNNPKIIAMSHGHTLAS